MVHNASLLLRCAKPCNFRTHAVRGMPARSREPVDSPRPPSHRVSRVLRHQPHALLRPRTETAPFWAQAHHELHRVLDCVPRRGSAATASCTGPPWPRATFRARAATCTWWASATTRPATRVAARCSVHPDDAASETGDASDADAVAAHGVPPWDATAHAWDATDDTWAPHAAWPAYATDAGNDADGTAAASRDCAATAVQRSGGLRLTRALASGDTRRRKHGMPLAREASRDACWWEGLTPSRDTSSSPFSELFNLDALVAQAAVVQASPYA